MINNVEKNLPYLSIVIPFRNDNYTLNAIEKLNFSLNILIDQLEKTGTPSEIIIVDWNSPDPNKPLINEINIKKKTIFVSVLIFEVPKSIHEKYKGNKNRNLVGEAAFNVGIRRSRGEFIVGKVSDTFYSKSLIEFISKKNLNKKKVYRLDRVDVKSDFPIPCDWEKHFKTRILFRKSLTQPGLHAKACGDFLLMSKQIWFGIRGFPENKAVVHHGSDGEALYAAIGFGAKQVYLKNDICIYKILHDRMYTSRISHKKDNESSKLIKIIFGNDNRNSMQEFLLVLMRIILGILNLPKTKISGVKTRSVYRYYLISNFRRIFFGASFIKNNNWGLYNHKLKKKSIIRANWDFK